MGLCRVSNHAKLICLSAEFLQRIWPAECDSYERPKPGLHMGNTLEKAGMNNTGNTLEKAGMNNTGNTLQKAGMNNTEMKNGFLDWAVGAGD